MRRTVLALTLVLATTSSAFASSRHGRGMSISIDDDSGITDCSAMNVRFDGERVPVISENVPVGNLRSLKVTGAQNGGVRVVGGAARYGITVCKAVAGSRNAAEIRASLRGNELVIDGPDENGWTAYVLVSAPRGADLNLSTSNGPISLDEFDGSVVARALNGPISVSDSSGKLDISTTNGPISLDGGSGDVTLRAQNGPLSVKLDGGSWNGTLNGSTQNGPLSVRLPRSYRSGVVVEARGGSPVTCRAEGCNDRLRNGSNHDDDDHSNWNRPRRYELGSGQQNVRLTTVNGPVSIKDRE